MTKYSLLLAMTLGIVFSFSSCGDDEPEKTMIHGTITIDNQDTWSMWQDSGQVELTIFPDFSLDPLAGWGATPDGFFSPNSLGGTFAVGAPYNSQNPIILEFESGKTTYDYELELEPGTYSALALGFRHDGISDPSRKSATLGVHWDKPATVSHGIVIKIQAGPNVITLFDYDAPSSITVTDGQDLEINFTADFNFVNVWYQ